MIEILQLLLTCLPTYYLRSISFHLVNIIKIAFV